MKTIKITFISIVLFVSFISCEKEDAAIPEPPSPVQLFAPKDQAINVTFPIELSWEKASSTNNERISYRVYFSKNNQDWIYITSGKNSLTVTEENLDLGTLYYWKVETIDAYKQSSVSETHSFTTAGKHYYKDGEVLQLQHSTKGNGVNIVILGDGFIKEDLEVGGTYENYARKAMEAFFLTEPYLSYREYFNFYTVFAESNERGADYENNLTEVKDTKFNASYDNTNMSSTYMKANNNKCWEYCKMAPNCDDIDKTLVVLMVNASRVAGYCHFWIQGRAIALCPVKPKTTAFNKQFENTVLHEAGGHGFAKLADEYLKYAKKSINANDAATISDKKNLEAGLKGGMFANVDTTNHPDRVKWRELYQKYPEKYKYVRSVEGAYYYGLDMFRPEPNSCMINNIKYYNAPSRMAIVKRIKFLAGETFSLEDFVANDKLLNFPPQNEVE